ncbi:MULTISPECIES: hypothetical protein [Paraburkholderia]|uniref:hypothetical protein n=1 Tax=Paraburkholderia TaxID=1822464 RepID=UPI0038BDFBAA
MKPITVDMLRAHLMVASLTAVVAEVFACMMVVLLPAAQHVFGSGAFRLASLRMMAGGVIVAHQLAWGAFQRAVEGRYASAADANARRIEVVPGCPRVWLVILHLRLTGKPFVLSGY